MVTMRIKLYSDSAGALQAEFLDGLSSISQNNVGNNVIEIVPDFALSENEALQMGFSTSINEADPSTQNVGFTLMENPETGIYRILVPPLVLATRGTWYLQVRLVSGWLEASERYANVNHSDWLEFEVNATIYDTTGAYPNNGDILALYGEAQRLKKATGRLESLEESTANLEETKLDKSAESKVVYANNSVGEPFTIKYTATPTPYTMVYRDGAGRFQAENPEAEKDVANKGYVAEVAKTKLDKADGKSFVYATDSNGDFIKRTYSRDLGRNALVWRDDEGRAAIYTPEDGAENATSEDITNRAYVKENFVGKITPPQKDTGFVYQQYNDSYALINYTYLPNPWTIASRNKNGQIEATAPTSSTHVANKAYVDNKVAALVDSAPETLDTLKEVATAIQENETVVEALNSAIGTKANAAEVVNLTDDQTIGGNKTFTGKVVADEIEVYSDDAGVTSVIDKYGGFRVEKNGNTTRYANGYIAINYPNTNFYFPTDDSSGTFATREWASKNFSTLDEAKRIKTEIEGNVTVLRVFISPQDQALEIVTSGDGYIDWGDGTGDFVSGDSNNIVHGYESAGLYSVRIYGVSGIYLVANGWYGYMGMVEYADYADESGDSRGSVVEVSSDYLPIFEIGMKLCFTDEGGNAIPEANATVIAIGETSTNGDTSTFTVDKDIAELVPMGGYIYLSPVYDNTTIFPNPIYEANISKFLNPTTAVFVGYSADGAQCAKKIIVPHEQLQDYKTAFPDFTGVETDKIFDSYALASNIPDNIVTTTGNQTITGIKAFTGGSTLGSISMTIGSSGNPCISIGGSFGGTQYEYNCVVIGRGAYELIYPSESGTFATREWVQEEGKRLYRHLVRITSTEDSYTYSFDILGNQSTAISGLGEFAKLYSGQLIGTMYLALVGVYENAMGETMGTCACLEYSSGPISIKRFTDNVELTLTNTNCTIEDNVYEI